MSDYKKKIETKLFMASLFSPHGQNGKKLYEEIVALADEAQDIEWQLKGRMGLMRAVTFLMEPREMLNTFSFILKQLDEQPQLVEEHVGIATALWMYKWTVTKLPQHPNFSVEQVYATFDDMANRFMAHGDHQKSVLQYRFIIHSLMGRLDDANKALEKFEASEGGDTLLNDCPACFTRSKVNHYIRQGAYEEAVECSQPILDGEQTCATIPDLFYHLLFRPLLLLDRKAEALALPQPKEQTPELKHLAMNGDAILLHSANAAYTKATELFEQNVNIAHESFGRWDTYLFYLGSQYLFKCLLQQSQSIVSLQLPETFPNYQADGQYQTAALLEWLQTQIRIIQTAFDERNKNSLFKDMQQDYERIYTMYEAA